MRGKEALRLCRAGIFHYRHISLPGVNHIAEVVLPSEIIPDFTASFALFVDLIAFGEAQHRKSKPENYSLLLHSLMQ